MDKTKLGFYYRQYRLSSLSRCRFASCLGRMLVICVWPFCSFVVMQPHPAWAQAPGLFWRTNLGATPFMVDGQTNVYANSGGKVIKISPSGSPLSTNTICPIPGFAAADPLGNYYFTGSLDGTQDFGGIVLFGGKISPFPPYQWLPGTPGGYAAKYSPSGNLIWAVTFYGGGPFATLPTLPSDLLPAADGSCYVGFVWYLQGQIAHITASGSLDWTWPPSQPGNGSRAVKLGGLTSSNCCFFSFSSGPYGGRISSTGSVSGGPNPGHYTSTADATNAKPVIDDLAQLFQAGIDLNSPYPEINETLCKYDTTGVAVWCQDLGSEEQWVIGRDPWASIYLVDTNGMFAKRTVDGAFVWSTNYGPECVSMTVDSFGNRFVAFADGSLARVADELAPQKAIISAGPQSQTLFVGDSTTLSVSAIGTLPFSYSWWLYGTNPVGANASSLSLNSVSAAQAGMYTVVISNAAGSVTNSPVMLRVKSVELYWGNQLLTNGTYTFTAPPTLTLRSAFVNGSSFYTLDGSAPNFLSTYYSGPFTLTGNATVRAIGYTADFSGSEEADSIMAVVPPRHALNVINSGGGSVMLSPSGGTYTNNQIVTATANPSPGWTFLNWFGDVSGTNSSVNVLMNSDKTIQAVFGTTLSTTVAGPGTVSLYPPGGLYPFGTVVRVTGVPQPANYFGSWGNAATGNTNPLYFAVITATPTISSIFAAVPAGQAALTTLINGLGEVTVAPRANLYNVGQNLIITATPDPGQTFLGWSRDASGTQNPLNLQMSASKVVTANFSSLASLTVSRPSDGYSSAGFRFTILSAGPGVWQVMSSSNLSTWNAFVTVTNMTGEVQVTDTGATNKRACYYKALPWQ